MLDWDDFVISISICQFNSERVLFMEIDVDQLHKDAILIHVYHRHWWPDIASTKILFKYRRLFCHLLLDLLFNFFIDVCIKDRIFTTVGDSTFLQFLLKELWPTCSFRFFCCLLVHLEFACSASACRPFCHLRFKHSTCVKTARFAILRYLNLHGFLSHDPSFLCINLILTFLFTFNHYLQLLQSSTHFDISLARSQWLIIFLFAKALQLHHVHWRQYITVIAILLVVLSKTRLVVIKNSICIVYLNDHVVVILTI